MALARSEFDQMDDEEIAAAMALEVDAARNDATEFIDSSILTISDELSPHPMHAFLDELLTLCWLEQNRKHCVVVWPPDHGKTERIARWIARMIGWASGEPSGDSGKIGPTSTSVPKLRSGLVSADKDLTSKNMMTLRRTLVSSLMRLCFPWIKPDPRRSSDKKGTEWSSNRLYIEGQQRPAAESFALYGASEGAGFDIGWFDDCVPRACQDSENARKKSKSALYGTWLKRVRRKGMAVISNNGGWHHDDAIHEMVSREAYCVFWVNYDGVDSLKWKVLRPPKGWTHGESGEWALWDRVPRELLVSIRKEDLGTYRRLYEQLARVPEDMRLPPAETWGTYRPEEIPGPETGARAIAYLDTAGGKHIDRGDFAALTVVLICRDYSVLVLDVDIERCSPKKQIKKLWNAHKKLQAMGYAGLHAAFYEVLPKDEGWVDLAIQAVKEEMKKKDPAAVWLPLRPDYPDVTAAKETRIDCLHEPLESKQVKFKAGFIELALEDTAEGRSYSRLKNQSEDFGMGQIGIHDDGPDSLEGAIRKAKEVGPGYATVGVYKDALRELRRRHAEENKANKIEKRDPETGKIKKKRPKPLA